MKGQLENSQRVIVAHLCVRAERLGSCTRASAAGAAHTQQGILWGSLLAALLVGGAALVVARAFTGPVRQVTAAARRIVAGT